MKIQNILLILISVFIDIIHIHKSCKTAQEFTQMTKTNERPLIFPE